jgi:hypothetical protein
VAASIELAMMTTNLMMRRPHRLPFRRDGRSGVDDHGIFLFRPADFRRLFPARICEYLIQNCDPFEPNPIDAGSLARPAAAPTQAAAAAEAEFYYFPPEDRLPITVAARMSLSFPLLISAVPLYARDFTLREPREQQVPRRCLFSDGGLTSNFPIHFFDRL